MDQKTLIILCATAVIAACLLSLIVVVVLIHQARRRAKSNATAANTRAKVYRVSYNRKDHTWVIKRDRAGRVIDSFFTKAEAIARVNELSANQDVGFTVKKKNGRFQKKDNY